MKHTERMIRRYYLLLGIIGLLGTAYFLGHHAGAIGQQLSSTNSTAANLTIGWLLDFGVEREKRATDANDNFDTCSCTVLYWYKTGFSVALVFWLISVAGMMICLLTGLLKK